ncbi:MAG: hypothetical protein GEV06_03640 [Luteitalea sp.]|nr:hypothetical protein [Luteitalea sp.]
MRQLVYVAGYGRSGSTLLDIVLGNHPQIFGAGELTWLFRASLTDRPCSCGQPLSACPVWAPVVSRVANSHPGLTLSQAAKLTLEAERLFGTRADLEQYVALWQTVCRAILEVTGRPILVDSTKSSRLAANRLPILAECLGVPVKILHVVRDPRAVMWSVGRGSNRGLEGRGIGRPYGGMARGLAGWMFSNYVADRTRRRFDPSASKLVRYEDFTRSPTEVLAELGEFLGVDLGVVDRDLQQGVSFDPGHGVAGNRMRRQGGITLKRDLEWQERLPPPARLLALLARPQARRYGCT